MNTMLLRRDTSRGLSSYIVAIIESIPWEELEDKDVQDFKRLVNQLNAAQVSFARGYDGVWGKYYETFYS